MLQEKSGWSCGRPYTLERIILGFSISSYSPLHSRDKSLIQTKNLAQILANESEGKKSLLQGGSLMLLQCDFAGLSYYKIAA